MFGAKYSRLKYWIMSIILFILATVAISISKVFENSETVQDLEFAFGASMVSLFFSLVWINTLANRIRDYGSSPWISLFALIPLVNIILGFYYGLKKKHSSTNQHRQVNNNNESNLNEDEIYEKIMIEIEENKKVKSTWAKALVQGDGDRDKAEAIYIKLRIEMIKEEQVNQISSNISPSVILPKKNLNLNTTIDEIKLNIDDNEYKKLLKEEEKVFGESNIKVKNTEEEENFFKQSSVFMFINGYCPLKNTFLYTLIFIGISVVLLSQLNFQSDMSFIVEIFLFSIIGIFGISLYNSSIFNFRLKEMFIGYGVRLIAIIIVMISLGIAIRNAVLLIK